MSLEDLSAHHRDSVPPTTAESSAVEPGPMVVVSGLEEAQSGVDSSELVERGNEERERHQGAYLPFHDPQASADLELGFMNVIRNPNWTHRQEKMATIPSRSTLIIATNSPSWCET